MERIPIINKKYNIICSLCDDRSDNISTSNLKRKCSSNDDLNQYKISITEYKRIEQKECELCKSIYCVNPQCEYTHKPLSTLEKIFNSKRVYDTVCACDEKAYPGSCHKVIIR